ncbi:MAG TPA: VOC family protein [Negativicutes bacterium]|nr:VOC family protein [Negativicutes bacterium]
MVITPNYHFNGKCEQALKLYEKAFNGRITELLHYCDANPDDMDIAQLSDRVKEYVYHAEMIIGGQRFFFSDSLESIPFGRNISTVVTFAEAQEVRAAYEILAAGGIIIAPMEETTYSSCFVSLLDRFGMRWELMTENKVSDL